MRFHRALSVFCLLLAFLTPALAWPPGTHAYIANQLNQRGEAVNLSFGAMAPDINQLLSTNQVSDYFFATHYPAIPGVTDQGFLDLWATGRELDTAASRSLGFGFATHNEAWGADYYAHIKSHLYPNYTNPKYPGQNGYVWVKADQLCRVLKAQLSTAGIDDPLLNSLLSDSMNCHFIVEYGMDLLLKGTTDPRIGNEVLTAAQEHDAATMQALFFATYTQQMSEPVPGRMGVLMAGAEPMWTGVLTNYGTALNLPMNQAVPAVAAFLEQLAESQVLNTSLPPEQKQVLTTVIELGLVDSLGLCAYDFNAELELTVKSVRSNLVANRVKY